MRITTILLILAATATPVQAAPVVSGETTQLRMEQRKDSEGDPRISTLGAFGTGNGKMARLDLVYMEAGEVVNDPERKGGGNVWGLEISAGYLIPTQITFYLAGGVMLGVAQGEFVSSFYPEVGLLFRVSEGVSITASKKRYLKLYGATEDAVLLGLALSYR